VPSHLTKSMCRGRTLLGAALAAMLVASCAPSDESGVADDTSPTFRRISDESLRYSEPLATTTDLVQPAEEGDPWRIVGSVFDPDSGRSRATVWTAADGRQWERGDIEASSGDASESMAAATTFQDSQVAVGRRDDGEQSDAALWQTGEGGWDQVAPEEMGGMHDQWAFDVAAGERGILVAGGENAWGEVRARLWFSPDGETWETVDGGAGGPFDTTGEESVQAVTAFGNGFVAVGWRDVDGEQDALAWYSPDGTSWEQLEAPSLRGEGRQNARSVTVVNGMVVAGGFQSDASGQGQPVVWRSPDGQNWSGASAPLPAHADERFDAADLTIRSFSLTGDQLLAAGGSDWRPLLWRSRDQGGTWELLPNPVRGQQFEDGISLQDVATFGELTLALGSEPTVIELAGERWTDATGEAFPTGGSKPAATTVLLQDGTTMVGGFQHVSRLENAQQRRRGDEGEGEGEGGEGGEAPPEAPASPEDPTEAPRDRYTGGVWLGRGPGGLEEVEASGDAAHLEVGKINDVAAFQGGYVAVGFEDFAVAAQRSSEDGKPDGLLWTSEDGRAWTRRAANIQSANPDLVSVLDGDPNVLAQATYEIMAQEPLISDDPAGGSGTRSLEAVSAINDGYIAVGSIYRDADGNPQTPGYDTDPLVVVSPDGNAIRGEDTGLLGPGTQRYRDVCVRDGTAVVVGSTSSSGGVDVAVNVRDRNRAWHAASATDESFGGPGRQEAYGCAVNEDGFIMVGADDSRGNSDARVWTSTDGMEWEMLPASALGGSGDQTALSVAPVGDGDDGWLIGGNDTVAGDSDIALWRLQADGELTRRDRNEPSLGGPGPQTLTAVAVNGRRTVVVGEDHSGAGIWESNTLDR
jgi:hypothetical protein